MTIKQSLSKPFATYVRHRMRRWMNNPHEAQRRVFQMLIKSAENTQFGREHGFAHIHTYEDFQKSVPIRDYEGFRHYIDKIKEGHINILWKGKPLYFCKTSGTTSGTKYIPISRESMPYHIKAARNALLCYIAETGNTNFIGGKMIFLQGSPQMDMSGKIPVGRLSGIVANHVPAYLQSNRMPSFTTNCIEDWESKIDAIVEETMNEDMRLISGIPSWVQMYFDRLLQRTGKKKIIDIFPDFSLFVHGGVNFGPYCARMETIIGKKIPAIETFPASEGFIAFQDSQTEEGLLLLLDGGIFYEFIPADQALQENPVRLSITEVEIGVNYALVLSTNAGLWSYNLGDTIKFVSKNPYRIIVTGRVAHFTSAFGEHVIAHEVEAAMNKAILETNAGVVEFHVAPQVNPSAGELPYHEWFIEFGKEPEDMEKFRYVIEKTMQEHNIYYRDLIFGNVLQPLKINIVKQGGFIEYMKFEGKLGGQNKVPRLANDRKIAEKLKT